jgi:DNA-binding NtrC family response regulator
MRAIVRGSSSRKMQKRTHQFRARLDALSKKFVADVVRAAMRERTRTTPAIAEYDVPSLERASIPRYRELRSQTLRRFEADYVTTVLRAASGNLSMAARIAQIDRKHFWRLIRRTGVRFAAK